MTEPSLEEAVMDFLASIRPRVDRMTETALRLRELQHGSPLGDDPWQDEITNLAVDTAAVLTDIVILLRPILRSSE